MKIARRRFLVLMNATAISPFLIPRALADIDDDFGDEDPGGDWGDNDDQGDDEDGGFDRDNDAWREDNGALFDPYGADDRVPDVAGSGLTEIQAAAVNDAEDEKSAPRPDPNQYFSEEPVRDLLSDAQSFLDAVIKSVKENVADFVSELDDMTYPLKSALNAAANNDYISIQGGYAAGPTYGNVNPQFDPQRGVYVTATVGQVPLEEFEVPLEMGSYITTGRSPDGSAYLAEGMYVGVPGVNDAIYGQTEVGHGLNFQVGVNIGAEDISIDVNLNGTIDQISAAYDRAANDFGQALFNIQQNLVDDQRSMNMR